MLTAHHGGLETEMKMVAEQMWSGLVTIFSGAMILIPDFVMEIPLPQWVGVAMVLAGFVVVVHGFLRSCGIFAGPPSTDRAV